MNVIYAAKKILKKLKKSRKELSVLFMKTMKILMKIYLKFEEKDEK
jgi:hypothetical protein